VLAAGAGSRLSGEGREALPKPLVPLADRPLLEHVIARLSVIGLRRIVVVLGHGHRKIEQFLKKLNPTIEVIPVLNPMPERENGYSLLQAEGLVEGQFLVAMADHLVDPAIYRAAARHRGLGLCVDFTPPPYLVAEATKVLVKEGKIIRIGKDLEEWNGLDTGVFSLTPLAFRALHRLEAQRELTLSEMVSELVRTGEPFASIDVSGTSWIDIDTPEDLKRAQALIRPGSSPSTSPRP
jgi:CDP-L-myo-inositol myo-inositolphosphotransferase